MRSSLNQPTPERLRRAISSDELVRNVQHANSGIAGKTLAEDARGGTFPCGSVPRRLVSTVHNAANGACVARRLLCRRRRFSHDAAEIAQKSSALQRPLHQHAATIHRVHLAAGEIEFAKPIQRAGDGWFGDIQLGGQTADRVRAVLKIAGQENTKLASGKIWAVAAHESDNGISKYANKLVG
jgi:hypothetical protein